MPVLKSGMKVVGLAVAQGCFAGGTFNMVFVAWRVNHPKSRKRGRLVLGCHGRFAASQ